MWDHTKRALASPWLIALALASLVAVALATALFNWSPLGGDIALVVSGSAMAIAIICHLLARKVRAVIRGLVLGLVLVVVLFSAQFAFFLLKAVAGVPRLMNRPWTWHGTEAKLLGGEVTVTLYVRSLHPPARGFLPVPGDDTMWRVQLRVANHPPRTIFLRDLVNEAPRLDLFLVDTGPQRILRLFDGSDEYYVDLTTAAAARKPSQPGSHLGIFMRNDGDVQYVPFFARPRASGELFWPSGVAVDSAGNVYVAEGSNNVLAKYSSDGRLIATWFLSFDRYRGHYTVAVDSHGFVWVLSWGGDLFKYGADGKLVRKWIEPADSNRRFDSPWGLALDARGDAYVTERVGRIQKISPEGAVLAKWGDRRYNPYSRFDPAGIAVRRDGTILVANRRGGIQRYTCDGELLGAWSVERHGWFSRGYPSGVAANATGEIFVSVWYKRELYIEKRAPDGKLLLSWKPGIAYTNDLVAVAASNGCVYVPDDKHHRILKFTSDGKPIRNWGSSPQ